MIKLCHENRPKVLEKLRSGEIDSIALSTTNLVDDIILAMHSSNILQSLKNGIPDKRAHNTVIPFDLVWALAIAAKMKVKTSLTDIPHAITDHRTLAKLGYTLVSDDGVGNDLMRESSLRFLLGKYDPAEFINYYNTVFQDYIAPIKNIKPNIHILDATDLEVNYTNEHYENSGIAVSKNGGYARGYKLATLRGVYQDTGVIEEIQLGAINTHDLTLSEKMLRTTKVFNRGDILINDRGFISRDLINYLKTVRGVDTYIPLRKNMASYEAAVMMAVEGGEWQPHPNKKRVNQKIASVGDVGSLWIGTYDVPINACVVWDTDINEYFVFITTDMNKSAKEIIMTYELRPEIEEDYRQLKDFWKIEDFKSTRLSVIAFHIACTLFGYLFFQLYTTMDDGSKYARKSLPVVLKGYDAKTMKYAIAYVGVWFGIFSLLELMDIYADSSTRIRQKLKPILEEV
ncbi:MAG: transposase [Methanomassiliicoccales archaeon]